MISFPAILLKTRNVDDHFEGSKADQGVEASKRRHRISWGRANSVFPTLFDTLRRRYQRPR